MAQVKCLTCKHIGPWSLPVGASDALRSIASCEKAVKLDGIPAVWLVQKRGVEVFSDGSGFPYSCKAWEVK